MSKPYVLNEKQRNQAQSKWMAAQLAQKEFQTFMAGMMAGLGLDGDWNLNTDTWTFEPIEKPKEKAIGE
uniref:Uncharacterized protein n=1 Tax=viral metagenome TaxID=1070528 RepID=A0A6M3XKM5_9ZZZZ